MVDCVKSFQQALEEESHQDAKCYGGDVHSTETVMVFGSAQIVKEFSPIVFALDSL